MLTNIKGRKLTNIILTGDVDTEDEIIDFLSDLTLLAFQFDDKYLIFEAIEQYSRISITESSELIFHEIPEEGLRKAHISLMNLLVINGELSDLTVDRMILYDIDPDRDSAVCEAVKIILSNGQNFFLDPCNFWGFTMGSELMEKNWLDNMQALKRYDHKMTIIEL